MFNRKRKVAIITECERLFDIVRRQFGNDSVFTFKSNSFEKLEYCAGKFAVIFIDLNLPEPGELGRKIFSTGFQGDILYINKKGSNGLEKRYENVIAEEEICPESIPDVDIGVQISTSVFLKRCKL